MLTAQQVDRFEIRDFLGRGAIGDVYLAWDPLGQREVALKVVRANRTDPDMLQAEKNGTALQEQLSRVAPQVAAVYEQGEDGALFWVAMEYVAGTDLSQRLARGPLPEDKAASIACQLCDMLEVCHNFSADIAGRKVYGIIHGDIKPENIRLQDDDRVRVLDFGIAKLLSQTRKFTVNLFGSLPYTPPERLDRGGVDRHSDLWAVGVVLFLMAAGYPPYDGDDPEAVEGKIRRGDPPSPLPESLAPGLRRIIDRSLEFQVARRYATAAAMKADLDAWLKGEPLPSEAPRPAMPGSIGEDISATRRTSRSLDDSGISETRRTAPRALSNGALDATRRTGALPVAAPMALTVPPPPSVPTEEPPPAPPPTRRQRFALRGAGLTFLLVGSVLVASQVWVRSEAAAMQHDLATQTAPDLDDLWGRYRKLAPFRLLPGSGLGDVHDELRSALLKSSDRVLDSYRGDDPTTTQKGWQKAHDRLQAAVDLDYHDRPTRAKLLYTQGQIDRIDSQPLRARGQKNEARQKVRDAIDEFQDAAKLAPDWPDPYLGLARVYAYEQPDLKQLEASLGELERRGYPQGKREKAMLADGYHAQAEQLLAQSQAARGTEQEKELLEQARDAFTQTIGLYRDAGSFADAKTNMAAAAQELRGILSRLEELGVW